jgi:predicted transcriptional regulator of viral defense system
MGLQLSKLESKAYSEIKKSKLIVFSVRDLCLLLNIDKVSVYNLIKALKNKNLIKNVGKRKFFLTEMNEFDVASELNSPSYISFWSALNYYGFSDNTPIKIFLATTRYSKEIKNFKYVTLSSRRFFGYVLIGRMVIAEKEKAIVDSLLFPKYSGGIKEIKKSLESAIDKIDIKKLIDYSIKIKTKSVVRRLGYLLDSLGVKKLKRLEENIGRGFILLDPSLEKRNNLNKKWLLDINI